jgi:tRNA-dihydrouridine synthase B
MTVSPPALSETTPRAAREDCGGSLPLGADSPWLAPLAGFSDLPFRLLCREMGAAVACTEMVSAKGLMYGLRRKRGQRGATEDLLATTPEDGPLVVQLFGEDPDFVGPAVAELRARGYACFDLNMGCSMPKVTKTGAGAALLREPDVALRVAAALFRNAGEGRAGCKLRLGWDASRPVYLDLAKRLEQMGAAWITLHPRFARQGFSGAVDEAALEKLVRAVSIPVLASGDLFTAEDALRRLNTGVRGVMFARGAMANPAVFRRYLALRRGLALPEALSASALFALIRRHAALALAHTPGCPGRKGLAPALLKMRTIVPRYARHLPGVRHLRSALIRCATREEFEAVLEEFFATPFPDPADGILACADERQDARKPDATLPEEKNR